MTADLTAWCLAVAATFRTEEADYTDSPLAHDRDAALINHTLHTLAAQRDMFTAAVLEHVALVRPDIRKAA